jgi:hypothetical protein
MDEHKSLSIFSLDQAIAELSRSSFGDYIEQKQIIDWLKELRNYKQADGTLQTDVCLTNKGSNKEVWDEFFQNMPKRKQKMMIEENEHMNNDIVDQLLKRSALIAVKAFLKGIIDAFSAEFDDYDPHLKDDLYLYGLQLIRDGTDFNCVISVPTPLCKNDLDYMKVNLIQFLYYYCHSLEGVMGIVYLFSSIGSLPVESDKAKEVISEQAYYLYNKFSNSQWKFGDDKSFGVAAELGSSDGKTLKFTFRFDCP